MRSSDFTKLFIKSSSGADSLLGSAYEQAVCSFQAGVVVPANGGIYKVDITWVADESLSKVPSCSIVPLVNTYLPRGEYKTKLSGSIRYFRAEVNKEISFNDYNLSFRIE